MARVEGEVEVEVEVEVTAEAAGGREEELTGVLLPLASLGRLKHKPRPSTQLGKSNNLPDENCVVGPGLPQRLYPVILSADFYVGGKIGQGRIVFIGVPHGPHSFVGPNPEHNGVAKVVHVVQLVVVTVGGAIGHGTRIFIGVPHGPQSVAGPTPPGQMGVGNVVHVVQAVVVGGRIGQGMRVLIGVPHGPQRVFGPMPPGQRGVAKVVHVVQAVVVGGGAGQGGWPIVVPHGPHRTDAGNPGQIGVEKVEQVVQGSPLGHAAAATNVPPYMIRTLERMNLISMANCNGTKSRPKNHAWSKIPLLVAYMD
ncbi:hypothetical protein TWF281_003511 [Arthrobotrys megalospora]